MALLKYFLFFDHQEIGILNYFTNGSFAWLKVSSKYKFSIQCLLVYVYSCNYYLF